MKKFVVLFAFVFCAVSGAWAQSYVFVNSETIFKSQADYNSAIKQLDDLSAEYQKNIDDAYAELDETFNNYAAQRGYLSETSRQNREEQIVNREKEIKKYQQDVFGPEGELMKKRIELIKPIQERVFAAINKYAETNNLGMVVDRANNQTLLYYQPALDKTDEIIKMLNNN
ncbi:Outer membrane protein [Alistipes sp. cv1]|jgi:outer membrane protein|nr:OmpH family outer membrane protein [uncultured Alistipes sp.]VDR35041.1 Outer membrane protein [Faecalibacterium prausnitzii]